MWNKPQLLNWVANLFYAIAVVMVLYVLVFIVVHLPIFPLREVRVEGHLTHVNREQVKLIVARHLKGNFFTLNLERTRDAFEKLPWARKVSVRRRWPDQIIVDVDEHEVLARWGDIALVNSHGELFHAASDEDLPTFYGPGNGVKEVTMGYQTYHKILSNVDIKISQVSLSPRRAWEIKTDQNMLINLGRVDMEKRLDKFAKSYQNTIRPLNIKITYADLRYPNGFAIRKPTGIAMPIKQEAKAA